MTPPRSEGYVRVFALGPEPRRGWSVPPAAPADDVPVIIRDWTAGNPGGLATLPHVFPFGELIRTPPQK
jgi:hypothetical protein